MNFPWDDADHPDERPVEQRSREGAITWVALAVALWGSLLLHDLTAPFIERLTAATWGDQFSTFANWVWLAMCFPLVFHLIRISLYWLAAVLAMAAIKHAPQLAGLAGSAF